MRLRALGLLICLVLPLVAQQQQRPLPGPGLPFPKKKKAQPVDADPDDLIVLKGMLRKITAEKFVIETSDKRLLTVQRTPKTKFTEKEAEIKSTELQPGDRLRVDATETDKGTFLAYEVSISKRGSSEERAQAGMPYSDDDDEAPGQPPRGKEAPASKQEKGKPVESESVERPATSVAPPDAGNSSRDEDGAPKLSRGKPRASASRKPVEEDAAPPIVEAPVKVARSSRAPSADVDAPPSADRDVRDTFIEKARDSAENFRESLPNYSVKQLTTRYQAEGGPKASFTPIDVVSADLVYENGKESYKNIQVNGKAPKGKIEETGSWSKGEFESTQRDIFHPATNADFRPSGTATIVNRTAKIYKFVVEQENSHWRISTEGQTFFPAYKGSVWIDKETSRVLRIEMQTRNIPKAFPIDVVELTLDYDFVRISGTPFLLPVHSENLSCLRGTSVCNKNVLDFRNYRKFGADSSIIFTPQE